MWSRISLFVLSALIISCSNDPEGSGDPTGVTTDYTIYNSQMESMGDLIVHQLDNGSFQLSIELTTTFTDALDIELYDDNAIDVGSLEQAFGVIDANTTGVFYDKPSGLSLSYNQLLNFDGHIRFSENGQMIAYSDIGENVLTGVVEDYPLYETDIPGISGEARFYERNNSETLVVVDLENTDLNGNHPAHIHNNNVVEGGGISISLKNIDGSTGLSFTNISKLDNGETKTYSELSDFDGYLVVHNSSADFGTLVSTGDIGKNVFTGEKIEYIINEVNNSGISGTVLLEQRKSNETLITVTMLGTSGVSRASHIHEGSAESGGPIRINFDPIDGNTGLSINNISETNSGSPISYDDLLTYNGYVAVHVTSSGGEFVATGNIGSNAN